jgi:hypothetical protein
MTDDLTPKISAIDASELDVEEQALAYFTDMVAGGADEARALQSASARFRGQTGLLADYALYKSALDRESPTEAETESESLLAIIESAAVSNARAGGDVLDAGLLKRIGVIGMSLEGVADRMHIARSVLTKLDRRLILPDSIPTRFVRELGGVLRTSSECLVRYFARSPGLSAAAEYKAAHAPRAGRPQSFDRAVLAAVENGELDASEREYWLESDSS